MENPRKLYIARIRDSNPWTAQLIPQLSASNKARNLYLKEPSHIISIVRIPPVFIYWRHGFRPLF